MRNKPNGQDKGQNLLKAMTELNLVIARLFFFAGLVYAEIPTIQAQMQPLRGEITALLEKGCDHKIPEMRPAYRNIKPQIEQYFMLMDRYVGGELPRAEMIQASEAVQHMTVAM